MNTVLSEQRLSDLFGNDFLLSLPDAVPSYEGSVSTTQGMVLCGDPAGPVQSAYPTSRGLLI